MRGPELYDVGEFWKFKMKVGRIERSEKVPGKRKLIRLKVDFGEGDIRTVVAGIGDQYDAKELEGRKMIFVTNLKPKKIAGIESQAMLIVAEDEETGRVYLITLGEDVPVGAKVW